MPRLLDYARTGDAEALAQVEEPQGEPASEYYNADSPVGSYLLFDGRWCISPQAQKGSFLAKCRFLPHNDALPLKVQGYVTEVRSSDGKALARWQGKPLEGFPEAISGRWLRRAAPILGDVNLFKEELGEEWNWLMDETRWPSQRHVALGAVIFPEEVQHQEFGDGWAVMQWVGSRRKKGLPRSITGSFVRSARAGPTDLAARMPAAAALADKSVVFFGLGAVGSPAAIELVRAGLGKLTLVDHDIVEPATVRRWPYGLTAFGEKKVSVLKERLAAEYPWSDVRVEEMRIGAAVDPGVGPRQGERLEQLIEGHHLIVDCTAEMGVNHFLSEFARVRALSYILANATPGAWGGIVARFEPASPCWMCFRHALYGDSRATLPPADPEGEVQPPGCAEPTFTGSSFDLMEVSLELVRVAAGLLGGNDGYPRSDWDAAALHLRDNSGRRVPPHWEPMAIPRRPECTCAISR